MTSEPDPMGDLLDNIDRLTKPNRSKIIQDGPTGSAVAGASTVTVTLPPLLTQLEDAIVGTIGIGGSGSLPNERNVLDSEALFQFLRIKTLIGDWARAQKSTVYPEDPGATLRAWYVAYSSHPNEVASARFYVGKTASWADQIVERLDPPRVRELPDRCPSCDAFYWWNPRDKHKYAHPLIVEYRLSAGASLVEEAKGKCRACDASWGARQLAYDLEQQFLSDWDSAIEHDTRMNFAPSLANGTTTV